MKNLFSLYLFIFGFSPENVVFCQEGRGQEDSRSPAAIHHYEEERELNRKRYKEDSDFIWNLAYEITSSMFQERRLSKEEIAEIEFFDGITDRLAEDTKSDNWLDINKLGVWLFYQAKGIDDFKEKKEIQDFGLEVLKLGAEKRNEEALYLYGRCLLETLEEDYSKKFYDAYTQDQKRLEAYYYLYKAANRKYPEAISIVYP